MRQWARRGVFALVSVAAGLTWMLVEDLDFLTWLMGDLGGLALAAGAALCRLLPAVEHPAGGGSLSHPAHPADPGGDRL